MLCTSCFVTHADPKAVCVCTPSNVRQAYLSVIILICT